MKPLTAMSNRELARVVLAIAKRTRNQAEAKSLRNAAKRLRAAPSDTEDPPLGAADPPAYLSPTARTEAEPAQPNAKPDSLPHAFTVHGPHLQMPATVAPGIEVPPPAEREKLPAFVVGKTDGFGGLGVEGGLGLGRSGVDVANLDRGRR
jgi:hypothetical protein